MAIHGMIGITRTNIVSQVSVYYHVPRQTPLVGKGVQMVDAVNGLETCELARGMLPINSTFECSIKEFAVVSQSHVPLHEPILNLTLRTRRHKTGLLKVYTVLKSFSCRHVKCPRKKKNDMAQMHLTPLSKLVDDVWGEKGTEERDAMEKQLKEEVNAYYLGEAIRKARQTQKLTQEELGERIGVQRAQISRLEKGHTIMTLPTLSRVFRALGIASATLDLGAAGKVALW